MPQMTIFTSGVQRARRASDCQQAGAVDVPHHSTNRRAISLRCDLFNGGHDLKFLFDDGLKRSKKLSK
jgi:hypothetical protein